MEEEICKLYRERSKQLAESNEKYLKMLYDVLNTCGIDKFTDLLYEAANGSIRLDIDRVMDLTYDQYKKTCSILTKLGLPLNVKPTYKIDWILVRPVSEFVEQARKWNQMAHRRSEKESKSQKGQLHKECKECKECKEPSQSQYSNVTEKDIIELKNALFSNLFF